MSEFSDGGKPRTSLGLRSGVMVDLEPGLGLELESRFNPGAERALSRMGGRWLKHGQGPAPLGFIPSSGCRPGATEVKGELSQTLSLQVSV